MFRIDRAVKPWKESAELSAQINLYGFWNETAFLTKSGDLGMVLRVPGVDYESLDSGEQEYAVKRLESALKAFGPGFHVYQYLFKRNRPEIPFASYDDPIVEMANGQRRRFFEAKRDHLYQIEIVYCILLEGARSKTGVGAALVRLFHDPAGAIGELRAQFTNSSMKTLLRSQIEQDLARLEQRIQTFTRQLADFMQIEVEDQQGQLRFFRRLLNYDDWRIAGRPQSTQFLDYQVGNSDIEAERDHLRVGDHFVRVLTMKEAITQTLPLVLDSLLKIPANFYVVTEWTPLPADKARKEVNKRRRHFNMSKTGFVSQIGNDPTKTNPRDVLVDESKQADIENLGDCLRALGVGQSLGDFSLTIVLYSHAKSELDRLVGEFTGVFTNADGNLFAETYNQLNAYFATLPGNYALNLRKLYLLNTNYADLSFLFTILPGEKTNPHLGTEYLAVLETDNATPYFLNLHNGEVAHTLILGMTGSGKSYLCCFLLQNAQKYAPLTFIFDIGSSFQSLTTIFGGTYLNVGQETRDFTINPFSLPPTKENLQFLFSFFRVLIEGNGQRYRLDFKEERKLWDAIERTYMLEPGQRTVFNFANIIGELKERLHRWTVAGQYGFLARGGQQQSAGDPDHKHLYMVDESSLASTKQMRDFLEKIGPLDRVLLVGDIRQHQGVDAGKPFEQLQQAGMPTVQLDQIVRQKDPELLKAVEHFSRNETPAGLSLLAQQGRILEIADPQMRYAAIARSYAAKPDGTLIVSPDNASRVEINQAVRTELQSVGIVDRTEHTMRVLTPRSDMTGADRAWAAHYNIQDVIHYQRGSREFDIEPKSYGQVVAINPKENLLTVQKQNGEQVTYDPSRLRGIDAYREIDREFAVGDRIQFTAPNKELYVANRDLATIEQIGSDRQVSVRMDNDKTITFDPQNMKHFDHGYAVTSHSAQGLTADRVLINVDTTVHPELISSRFAYVAVSRASDDARLFTSDAASMNQILSRDSGKSSALELRQQIDNQKQTMRAPGIALSL